MSKGLDTAKRIISTILVIITVSIMIFTIISVTCFNRNDRQLFGFKFFIVLSDSMAATDFSAGDLVVVRNVDPTTLKEGDIIAFSSQNTENYGETVTHKIRAKTTDANGDPGFITYGTTTNVDDETIVTFPYINGKYKFHIPKLGTFFNFLRTTPGYIVCILIPFLLLIGMQGLNTVKLFRRYKKEQLEEIQTERAEIEAEKKRSEEMMEEILKLKAQLSETGSSRVQTPNAPRHDDPDGNQQGTMNGQPRENPGNNLEKTPNTPQEPAAQEEKKNDLHLNWSMNPEKKTTEEDH